jgi:hypothetical protein
MNIMGRVLTVTMILRFRIWLLLTRQTPPSVKPGKIFHCTAFISDFGSKNQ